MRRPRGALALVAVVIAGCSSGSDVEITTTRRAAPPTTEVIPPPTDEPPPTTEDTTPPTDDTSDDTVVDTTGETVVDTTIAPPDPEDPASSTTSVEPVAAADTYPLGTEVLVDDVGFKVTEYIPDAAPLYEDPFLEAPAGWQLVAVRAVLTNYSPSPVAYLYPDPTLVLPDGTGFPVQYCAAQPWLIDMTNVGLMSGGSADTVTCFMVPTDVVDQVSLWLSTFNTSEVVFALQAGQGSKAAPPPPARPAPPAPGAAPPGSWKTPIPLNTAREAGDYTVTVTGFSESAPTPEFTAEPPEGWRYVGADLQVTFNGSDPAEAGFVDLAVVGDTGRLYREDFSCQFDDEGDPFNPEPGGTQAWSRCFVVQDVDIPSLELSFQPDFGDSAVFFAVR